MDYFTNNKIIKWGLLLLFVINIAALSTIAIKGFKPPPKPPPGMPPPPDGPPPGTIGMEFPDLNRFIKDEMNFSDEQKKKFEELRTNYFERSKPLMDSLRENKLRIIGEIAKDNPDKNFIKFTSDGEGKIQSDLESLNADFFIILNVMCNESQKKSLQKFLNNLSIHEKPEGKKPPPAF